MSGLAAKFTSFLTPRNLAITTSAVALALVLFVSLSPAQTYAQQFGSGSATIGAGARDGDADGAASVGDGVNANGSPETDAEEPVNDNQFITWLKEGMAYVAWIAFTLFAMLMGIAGVLLNLTVKLFILDFGGTFAGSSGMLTAWDILKNIANFFILIGTVYISILGLFGVTKLDAKKAIPMLIISALLLNLSFFITAFGVDISNAISTSIYNQAIPPTEGCTTETSGTIPTINSSNPCASDGVGLSGAAFSASGLSGILGVGDGARATIADKLHDPGQEFLLYLMMTLFVGLCAFVFLSIVATLFHRGVIQILLLIFSPMGFVGLSVPLFKETADMWWKAFISSIVYPVAILLLLLVALGIANGIDVGQGEEAFIASAMKGEATGMNGIVMYIISMALLVACVPLAYKFSTSVTSSAIGFGRSARDAASKVGTTVFPNRKPRPESTSKGVRAPLQDGVKSGADRARQALRLKKSVLPPPAASFKRGDSTITAKSAGTSKERAQVDFRPVTPVQGSGGSSTRAEAPTQKPLPETTKNNIERSVVIRGQMGKALTSEHLGKLQRELQKLGSQIALADVADGENETDKDYILAQKELVANEKRIEENNKAMNDLNEEIKKIEEQKKSGSLSRTAELEEQRLETKMTEERRLKESYAGRQTTLLKRIDALQSKLERPEFGPSGDNSGLITKGAPAAPANHRILSNEVSNVPPERLNAMFDAF